MAVVKIKAIRSTLGKAIGYITDGSKTNSGLMCSSNCSIVPGMAEDITANMELTLALADHSRRFGKPPSVVAYHVIQSFKPGEVDPNDAHDLGWEFAMAITKDEYDVVCATHLDRGHVHNHIIFCAANRETLKRYRNPKQNLHALQDLSDNLCRKHGLSVIERPGRGKSLESIYAQTHPGSAKERLMNKIDEAVATSFTWEAMVATLAEMGVKVRPKGVNIVFTDPDMSRPIRGRTLGAAYTEAALMMRLGREHVAEFSLAPRMVHIKGDQARIRIPGHKPPAYFRVDASKIVDHGSTYRLFLPQAGDVTVTDRGGKIMTPIAVADLYHYFDPPQPARELSSAPHSPSRGISANQQRFFAHVDRKVSALRDEIDVVNTLADYDATTPSQRAAFIDNLGQKVASLDAIVHELILERQNRLDAGLPVKNVDARLAKASRQRRNLAAVHTKLATTVVHERNRR